QLGHRERGRTTDSWRGTRYTTTFRNEPTARPSTPATIATSAVTVRRRYAKRPGPKARPLGESSSGRSHHLLVHVPVVPSAQSVAAVPLQYVTRPWSVAEMPK